MIMFDMIMLIVMAQSASTNVMLRNSLFPQHSHVIPNRHSVFVAAIHGAVDSQLTRSSVKHEAYWLHALQPQNFLSSHSNSFTKVENRFQLCNVKTLFNNAEWVYIRDFYNV